MTLLVGPRRSLIRPNNLYVPPALGTPTNVVNNSQSGSGNTQVSGGIGADVDINSLLFGSGFSNTSRTLSSITDSAGITNGLWTISNYAISTFVLFGAYLRTSVLIPNGTTFTYTFSGACAKICSMQKVANINASPLDAIGAGATDTNTAPTSAVTTTYDGSIVFNTVGIIAGESDTYTPPGDYTNQVGGTRSLVGRTQFRSKIVSPAGLETFLASNSASRQWLARSYAFRKM